MPSWACLTEQFLRVPVGSFGGASTGIGSLRGERFADGGGIVELGAFRTRLALAGGVVEDRSGRGALDGFAVVGG